MTDKPKPTAGDRERARKIVSRICLLNDGHTPSGCGLDCELDEDELVEEAFAQALADERARCAGKLEAYFGKDCGIAKAIREGDA